VIDDPRFATNRQRIENAAALEAELAPAIAARTSDEALAIMEEASAPSGPVLDTAQIFDHPHYAARGNIVAVDDDELGAIRMQAVTPRLSRTPGRIGHAGPRHGQHTDEVYAELLGLDADELAELRAQRVI
jgi:crotonobetainyl-CoA:carnitine CoA-transferase CaiB-like acyl-CoA transferase